MSKTDKSLSDGTMCEVHNKHSLTYVSSIYVGDSVGNSVSSSSDNVGARVGSSLVDFRQNSVYNW